MKDLLIEQIYNVYYSKTSHWKRNTSKMRNKDGIVLFLEGEIEYIFPDRTIVATAGSLLFFPGNVPYRGVLRSETVAYFVVDFQSDAENGLCELGAPCAVRSHRFESLSTAFSEVTEAWNLQRMDARFQVRSLLYATLAELAQERSRVGVESVTRDILS